MKIFAGVALILVALGASAQGTLTVYCSIIDEQCRAGVAAFERATGIKVTMVRRGTGETYAQIRAEASNPRGDVWWGGPGDPHLQAGEEGLLEEYKSPKLAELHPWAVRLAELSKYRTAGTYLGALGVGYNTEVLKKKNIPEPKCWADLLDARFRDEVQIADPNSSGTAYVMLATIVQLMGEDKGFAYLKALHRVPARHGHYAGGGRAGADDGAVRGNRLRNRRRVADQGPQEQRSGENIFRLGAVGRGAEDRRRRAEYLFHPLEQGGTDPPPGAGHRFDQADLLRFGEVRLLRRA
jgi:hypothetical protein